jgi:hypothetical protein
MTRFKELARIEAAIQQQNKSDLQWALNYCRMRVSISARKEHLDYWKKIEKDVIQAIESSS